MKTYKNITGMKFGRLTVLVEKYKMKRDGTWLSFCECECGKKKAIAKYSLTRRTTKSCGCLKQESKSKTHGQYGSPEYNSWRAMKNRCKNKTFHASRHYLGKGITYIKEWESFERFLADMGKKPTLKHSLDRIDNDKNYCKSNCRWATPLQQANNSSICKTIEYNGVKKTLSQWARELKIDVRCISRRLKSGWSVKQALFGK